MDFVRDGCRLSNMCGGDREDVGHCDGLVIELRFNILYATSDVFFLCLQNSSASFSDSNLPTRYDPILHSRQPISTTMKSLVITASSSRQSAESVPSSWVASRCRCHTSPWRGASSDYRPRCCRNGR